MLWTIGLSILLGAMSYPVMNELARRKGFTRWTLDTRLVVLGTLGLWATGAVTVLLFEVTNPLTLGGMSVGDKISNGAFQAFTARTSGFSSIDFGQVEAGTSFLYMVMMFVGGASGSVAGGIKVNTAMVIIVATIAAVRGRSQVEFARREIAYSQVSRALGVLVLGVVGVSLFNHRAHGLRAVEPRNRRIRVR